MSGQVSASLLDALNDLYRSSQCFDQSYSSEWTRQDPVWLQFRRRRADLECELAAEANGLDAALGRVAAERATAARSLPHHIRKALEVIARVFRAGIERWGWGAVLGPAAPEYDPAAMRDADPIDRLLNVLGPAARPHVQAKWDEYLRAVVKPRFQAFLDLSEAPDANLDRFASGIGHEAEHQWHLTPTPAANDAEGRRRACEANERYWSASALGGGGPMFTPEEWSAFKAAFADLGDFVGRENVKADRRSKAWVSPPNPVESAAHPVSDDPLPPNGNHERQPEAVAPALETEGKQPPKAPAVPPEKPQRYTLLPHIEIPPDSQSRPVGKAEAAQVLGFGTEKSATTRLRDAIRNGTYKANEPKREHYIFNLDTIPTQLRAQLKPLKPPGDSN